MASKITNSYKINVAAETAECIICEKIFKFNQRTTGTSRLTRHMQSTIRFTKESSRHHLITASFRQLCSESKNGAVGKEKTCPFNCVWQTPTSTQLFWVQLHTGNASTAVTASIRRSSLWNPPHCRGNEGGVEGWPNWILHDPCRGWMEESCYR